MIHFHKWEYIGHQRAWHWLAGVMGGVMVSKNLPTKQCTKCGKKKAA